MKKKSFFTVFTILIITVAFALSGCDFKNDEDSGDGWPSDPVLRDYGLDGLRQPAGVTLANWRSSYYKAFGSSEKSLTINFNGSDDACKAIRAYFSDWVSTTAFTTSTSAGSFFHSTYEKGDFRVSFTFNNEIGSISSKND